MPPSLITADIVIDCLDAAGEALMAIRVRGVWLHGYRSAWPEPLRDEDDWHECASRSAEAKAREYRMEPPGPDAIAHMDEVFFYWLPTLGGSCGWHMDRRRLLSLRALCWPNSDRVDPHVCGPGAGWPSASTPAARGSRPVTAGPSKA